MSGLVLSQLISELRINLAVDSADPDYDDTACTLLLNRTLWEIFNKFPFRETEVSANFITVASQREYPVAADFQSIHVLSVIDPNDGTHTQLQPMSKFEYENLKVDQTSDNAKPTRYFRGDGSVVLWPTPDKVYTMVVHYEKGLSDLSTSNTTPPIGTDWHEIILFGASWRGAMRLGNEAKVKMYKPTYYNLIASTVPQKSKDMADNSQIGIEMPGRDY